MKLEHLSLICETCHETLFTLTHPPTDVEKARLEAIVEAHKQDKPYKEHRFTARAEAVVGA